MEDLHFLYNLKWLNEFQTYYFFLSLIHINTNSAIISEILFSIASALLQDFLSNQTHIAKIPFWFLEHKIPQSILYVDCYFSQEHLKIA